MPPPPTEPPQPGPAQPGKLIQDDPRWWYQGHGVTTATRRMRLYEMPDGRLTAVVTESGDGTSITNAAETVIAQVQAEHPGRQVDVIEHYPASQLAGESFDLVQLDRNGRPQWTRIPAAGVADMLGPGVFTNGSGPTPAIRPDHEDEQWYLEAQGGAMDGRRIRLDVDHEPEPSVGHHIEVGTDPVVRLASVSCSCGWAEVVSYARDTGQPVAERLARLKGEQHVREAGG